MSFFKKKKKSEAEGAEEQIQEKILIEETKFQVIKEVKEVIPC